MILVSSSRLHGRLLLGRSSSCLKCSLAVQKHLCPTRGAPFPSTSSFCCYSNATSNVCTAEKNSENSRKPRKGFLNTYNSRLVEQSWYKWWESQHFFSKNERNREGREPEKFLLCLPPPNVTGNLHLGHVLTVTVEDVIARWKRMSGYRVEWIGGFDHAGIATQLVLGRKLWMEQGKQVGDISRELFLQDCQQWKNERISDISNQLRRLGASLEWPKTFYTMDKNFTLAVTEALKVLHKKGILFRAKRLVNWCPHLQSTISDQEVRMESVQKPQCLTLPGCTQPVPVGWLYYIHYPLLSDQSQRITIATTRPETILGDVAVAVHPDDDKYRKLVGEMLQHPLIADRQIPIIADGHVKPEFGTGALKVTPAHDFNDWDIGKRNNLPLEVECIDELGRISEGYGEFSGLDRFSARTKIVEKLETLGLFTEKKPQPTLLPLCDRSGDIVEPRLKEQWFLDCKQMAKSAIDLVECGKINIDPESFHLEWIHWLRNSRDWCLSRQLYWGHRIPAYRNADTGEWTIANNEAEACSNFLSQQSSGDSECVVAQDEDVLDTWFSAALVPLVLAGWPADFRPKSYPLDIMITGHDILGFWVTRMAMLCHELAPQGTPPPFPKVLFHGIIRDAHGEKMSKSRGNVVDPVDVIEGADLETLHERLKLWNLSQDEMDAAKKVLSSDYPNNGMKACGADALRFGILKNAIKDQSGIRFSVDVVEDSMRFCNKIWNGFKYASEIWNIHSPTSVLCAQLGVDDNLCNELLLCRILKQSLRTDTDMQVSTLDLWIGSRLRYMLESVDKAMESSDLHLARLSLHEFWLKEFCDVYLEYTKQSLWRNVDNELKVVSIVLNTVVSVYLRTMAPFMPFLAEELWSHFMKVHNDNSELSIHQSPWPTEENLPERNIELEEGVRVGILLLSAVRSIRSQYQLLSKKVPLTGAIHYLGGRKLNLGETLSEFFIRVGNITLQEVEQPPTNGSIQILINETTMLYVFIPNTDKADVMSLLEKQLEGKTKKKTSLEGQRTKLKLDAENFSKQKHKDRAVARDESLGKTINKLENEIYQLQRTISQLRYTLDEYYFKTNYGINYEPLQDQDEDVRFLTGYGKAKDFVQADDFYPNVRYGEAFGGLHKEVQVNTIQTGEWIPITHVDKMLYHSSDFANSTSAHGIPWIAKAENTVERVLWILVYLCCVGNFLFQIVNVVQKYQRNEKIVDIQLKFESVAFPSVTLCNLNPYKYSATWQVPDIARMLEAMNDAMDSAAGKVKEDKPAHDLPPHRRKREEEEHHKVVFEMTLSDCECKTGPTEECQEKKMNEPEDLENPPCLCSFDRQTGDAWPCFMVAVWTRKICPKCNEEMICTEMMTEGFASDCYCNPQMCIAYDNSVMLKLWEYYGAGAPTEDPGFLEALGFGGMTDEVAILTKARENMMFAMAGISNEDRIAMSYSQHDLIHKCSYNGQQCDMDHDFVPHLDPVYGQCFTYNHNRSVVLRSGRAGPMYGLRMMVYVNLTEYLPTTEAAGVRMTVHNKDEFAFPDTFGYSAPVGYISSFGIRLKSMDRLPAPYGKCIPGGNMEGFIYEGYGYSTEGCFRSCFQNLVIDFCKCGDPRFPVTSESKHCSMSDPKQRKCLDMRTKDLGGMHGKFDCACAQPCKQSMYDTTYSAAVWPAKALKVGSCPLTPRECADEYRKNGAMIEVFYEQLNFEMLEESQAYGVVNLLSDFGGQLGLWLEHHYTQYKAKQAERERSKNSG